MEKMKLLIAAATEYVRKNEEQELNIEWDAEGIKIDVSKFITPTISNLLIISRKYVDVTGWVKTPNDTLTIFYKSLG